MSEMAIKAARVAKPWIAATGCALSTVSFGISVGAHDPNFGTLSAALYALWVLIEVTRPAALQGAETGK